MNYLLDTNLCIGVLRGKNQNLLSRFAMYPASSLYVCSVVVAELCSGAENSNNPSREQARVDAFLANYRSLPVDDAVARIYAFHRVRLSRLGLIIADLDLLIAATALAHGLTLVSHNLSDFCRIPGLLLEDWEGP